MCSASLIKEQEISSYVFTAH